MDGSLFAEMCSLIYCGFPLYSDVQAAFPSLLEPGRPKYRSVKAFDFRNHLWGQSIIEDRVVYADGYKMQAGWYIEHNYSTWCVQKLSGCTVNDNSCEDRYAYQKLIRGPFKPQAEEHFKYLTGAPANLKKALVTLPHAIAPRLDAAVHLRCQFSHFEYMVGPEDSLWPNHQKEIQAFLQSKDFNAGDALFQLMEQKIMEELTKIVARRNEQNGHRLLQHQPHSHNHRHLRRLGDGPAENTLSTNGTNAANATVSAEDLALEKETFYGDDHNDHRIFVYLASDNDDVKEAFASYLRNHANISVVRVKTGRHISHAKDVNSLKSDPTGVFTLVMDWYALSLANELFGWRRDTHLVSTFIQSAQRVSGNSLRTTWAQSPFHETSDEPEDELNIHSKGHQLITKGFARWTTF